MTEYKNRLFFKLSETADNGFIVRIAAVAMQLNKIVDDILYVVERIGTIRVTG
jgi:hypothetical protein